MSCQCQYIDDTLIYFLLGKLAYVGRNYAERAKELNNPVPTESLLSIKPDPRVVPMSGGLDLPQERGPVHYGAEIAASIGKPLSREPDHEEVLDAISGYVLALDLTLHGVQAKLKEKDLSRELTKSFDSVDVLSPLVDADQFPDPTDISIRLTINGEVRQDDDSCNILSLVMLLIQHIARHFLLQAGGVVLTGTSSGVGPLDSGDEPLLKLLDASHSETCVF